MHGAVHLLRLYAFVACTGQLYIIIIIIKRIATNVITSVISLEVRIKDNYCFCYKKQLNNKNNLLTAIGLTPGGSSTGHIYTQTIHRTTQLNITTQLIMIIIIIIIVTQPLILSIFFNLTTDFLCTNNIKFCGPDIIS